MTNTCTVTVRRFEVTREHPLRYWESRCKSRAMTAFGEISELPEAGAQFEVDLDRLTAHHDNQFSTVCGKRLFDMRILCKPVARDVRHTHGYYLDGLEPIQELRTRLHRCGYCGHSVIHANGYDEVWCSQCLDSQYLKRDDLRLLEMLPLSMRRDAKRDKAPPAPLLEAYMVAQENTHTGLTAKWYDREITQIDEEAGKLVQRQRFVLACRAVGIPRRYMENHIYYSHTKTHVWGWRKQLSYEDAKQLRGHIYELTTKFADAVDGQEIEIKQDWSNGDG